jgi:cellulose synthase/poly-beta-1,6-N-acetylglucosamine synthase-like glycosyltransferase
MNEFDICASVAAILYLLAVILMAIYGLHSLWLLILHQRHHRAATAQAAREDATPLPADLPHVLVQLPVFNERDVVTRLVDAVGRLDWPADRLHIQLLDDSTDDSVAIGRAAMADLRRRGLDAISLHRTDRTGFKAGALDAGLRVNDAPFIAIFDADFVPQPDFIAKAIKPLLADPGLGLVQGRWEHLNRDTSTLTRAQAMGIDGHFAIEQGARAWSGLAMNFNGTCGMWRRAAIIEAGGWEHDTLTEDMDLSYRAQLVGWRCAYRVGLAVPGEIPDSVGAWRSQQFRWAKGSIQTAIKLLPAIWRTAAAPAKPGGLRWSLHAKLAATLHMTHYAIHPLMLVSLVTAPLALCVLDHPPAWLLTAGAISFLIGAGTPILLYIVSQFLLDRRQALRRLRALPALCAIGTGIAISNGIAVWQAIRGQQSEFVRTPKAGSVGVAKGAGSYKPSQASGVAELCCSAYAAFGVGLALSGDYPWIAPLLAIYFSGFAWMGLAIIAERWSATPADERASTGPWLLPTGTALVALAVVVGLLPQDWTHHPRTFAVAGLLMGAAWLAATIAAWRHEPGRRVRARDLGWILLVAVAMRAGVLGMAPGNGIDHAITDGRLLAAGGNPYVDVAATTVAAGPLVQAYQAVVTSFSATPLAFQIAGIAVDLAALAVLIGVLWRLGLPATRIVAAAWCPAPVLWFAGEAHATVLISLLIAGLAYLMATGHRARAGLIAGLAILAKPAAAILLIPAAWHGARRALIAACVTISLGALLFSSAGIALLTPLTALAGSDTLHQGVLAPHLHLLASLLLPAELAAPAVVASLIALWITACWLIIDRHRDNAPLTGTAALHLTAGLLMTTLLCLPHLAPWMLAPVAILLPVIRSWGLALFIGLAPLSFLQALQHPLIGGHWIITGGHAVALLLLITEAGAARRQTKDQPTFASAT